MIFLPINTNAIVLRYLLDLYVVDLVQPRVLLNEFQYLKIYGDIQSNTYQHNLEVVDRLGIDLTLV